VDAVNEPVTNVDAEANLLAALLQDGTQITPVLDVISPDDLWEPRSQLLLSTMASLAAKDVPVDPRRVSDELMRTGQLTQVATWLPNLVTRDHVMPLQAPYYAGMVLRASRQRQLQALSTGVAQRAIAPDADPDEILDFVDDESRRMRQQLNAIDGPLPTISELASRDNTMRWVVPGLIAEHDRIILVGHEGFGKSLCVTQIAMAAAAGVHPFTHHRIPQTRVLVVDCENDPDTVTDRADLLLSLSLKDGLNPSDHITYVERPGGLELSKGQDASWLSRLVARTRPQMLVIGPLYRLTESDLAKDEASRGVIAALDRVRLRAGCALLMEAHVGNEGIRKEEHVFRLVDYRGKRSKREWPEYLCWGKEGSWPWRSLSAVQVKEIKLLSEAAA
jgi:hypothetical protein